MFNKLYYNLKLLISLYPGLISVIILIIGLFVTKTIHNFHIFHKKSSLNKKQKTKKMLNFIYISDILIEILDIIFLIGASMGFIIVIRFLNLGKSIDIWLFESSSFTLIKILNIIIALIILSLYMKNLTLVLKDKMFKIYLYLLQYDLFFKIITNLNYKYNSSTLLFSRIIFNFKNCLPTTSDGLLNLDTKSMEYKILFCISKCLKNNKKLELLFVTIYTILEKDYHITFIERCLRKYFPYIIIYISILYDLRNQEIKYFYYSLFFCLIVNFYRKIKQIIGEYDLNLIDVQLTSYFYTEKTHEKVMKALDSYEEATLIYKSCYGMEIYNDYKENIRLYIERNYRVDYIDIKFKKSYQPYNMRLLFIMIFSAYVLFCYNLSLLNNIIITIPLFLVVILYEYSFKHYKNVTYTKILYIFLIIISIIIFIWIYLTRHNFYLITETIWSTGILIEQNFTLIEKVDLLEKYLNYFMEKNNLNLTSKQKLDFYVIIKQINFYEIIKETTDISQIKNLAKELVNSVVILDDIYYGLKQKILLEDRLADIPDILKQRITEKTLSLDEIKEIINDYKLEINNPLYKVSKKFELFFREHILGLGLFISLYIYDSFIRREMQEYLLQIDYKKNALDIMKEFLDYIRKFFE